MDRPRVLASLNGRILAAYSRDTVGALRGTFPLRLLLPHLEPLLEANVSKETRKDVLAIQCASELARSGAQVSQEAVREVLEATKRIDREFLYHINSLPVRVVIRYEEVAPIRAARIECLMDTACRILAHWRRGVRLRRVLHALYMEADFERLIYRVLRLYALETQALSRAVRLPALLVPLRERAGDSILRTMEEVAHRLAHRLARGAYRRRVDPRRLYSLQ
jgi:hypothetical protein